MDHSGNLMQLLPNRESRRIASGIPLEMSIEFAPDGTLYGLDWTGLFTIDIETGDVTKLNWFDPFSNNGDQFDFDSQGNMVTFHANHPIYEVSLAEKTCEMRYHPRGNTTAMALDPAGVLYLAYGNQLPSGESVVYRLKEQGDLEEVLRLSYGLPLAMAFDAQGTGYISLSDRVEGQAIHSFDPQTGASQTYVQPQCYPQSLAVDPVTDYLWWVSCDDVYYRDGSGVDRKIAAPEGSNNKYLFFGLDGTLYAMLWFGSYGGSEAMPHGIFQLAPDGSWTEVADLTNDDPFITWAMGAVCPDGTIYTVTHMDVQLLGIQGIGSLNAVLRVEPNSELTTIAGGFPVDAFAVLCEQETGDLLFTTIEAIFRFYKTE
jgi:sugar lactone lactonase YvrE